MRAFLTLLLCFLLAFQGSWAAHAAQDPCPMGHHGDASWVAAQASGASAGDCCHDAETMAQTGKMCKTDMPCGSFAACILPLLTTQFAPLQACSVLPALTAVIASVSPSGIWRPPSLI